MYYLLKYIIMHKKAFTLKINSNIESNFLEYPYLYNSFNLKHFSF